MVVTDTIADMLTRIRNANALRYTEVAMPTSKMKVEIASILKSEGFINDYSVDEDIIRMNFISGDKLCVVSTGGVHTVN